MRDGERWRSAVLWCTETTAEAGNHGGKARGSGRGRDLSWRWKEKAGGASKGERKENVERKEGEAGAPYLKAAAVASHPTHVAGHVANNRRTCATVDGTKDPTTPTTVATTAEDPGPGHRSVAVPG